MCFGEFRLIKNPDGSVNKIKRWNSPDSQGKVLPFNLSIPSQEVVQWSISDNHDESKATLTRMGGARFTLQEYFTQDPLPAPHDQQPVPLAAVEQQPVPLPAPQHKQPEAPAADPAEEEDDDGAPALVAPP